MKASDYIALYLERRRVTHVFELVGGMITFLIDSLHRQTTIKIVSMHHEQGAGFAAEGYGRISDVPGVAMATSGPGATNLLTAIGSSYFDSIPAIFITGQVNRDEQKCNRNIRQLGFFPRSCWKFPQVQCLSKNGLWPTHFRNGAVCQAVRNERNLEAE